VSGDVVAGSVVTASVVTGASVGGSVVWSQFVQTISQALKSSSGANARVPQSTTHTQFSLTLVFVCVVGAVVGVVVGSHPDPTQSRVQAVFRSTSSDERK
jgi:ABC-type glucose/galactose transport system permease subunit